MRRAVLIFQVPSSLSVQPSTFDRRVLQGTTSQQDSAPSQRDETRLPIR